MPAQWPTFINNLSKKLASRDSKGPDDMGTFVANEYFNAVKTAQTPFGNIHEAGKKSILESGFKKAFNLLFDCLDAEYKSTDAYDAMSKCILDYWKSTKDQPFAAVPPIPPCLIPDPGTYVAISYGNEAGLSADLKKAWNAGISFKPDSGTQTATKAVASAMASACTKHLKDLSFIYNGKIPTPGGPVPMVGTSPTAL
jgi:hypothetical protein